MDKPLRRTYYTHCGILNLRFRVFFAISESQFLFFQTGRFVLGRVRFAFWVLFRKELERVLTLSQPESLFRDQGHFLEPY